MRVYRCVHCGYRLGVHRQGNVVLWICPRSACADRNLMAAELELNAPVKAAG